MTITPQNGDLTAGVAGYYNEDIAANANPFITGDHPPVVTTDELVAASQTLAARTVVGFNDAGALVAAVRDSVDPDDDVAPIGILVYAVTTGGGDTTVRTGVYRQGTFNPDLIVWPPSFNTAEEKRLAFEGAPSPTAIVLRAPQTLTV